MRKKKIGAILIALGLLLSTGTGYIAKASEDFEQIKVYSESKEEVISAKGKDIELKIGEAWSPELHEVTAVNKNDSTQKYVITPIINKEDPEDIINALDEKRNAAKVGKYRVTFIVTDGQPTDETINDGVGIKAEFVQIVTIKSEDSKKNGPQITGSNVGMITGTEFDEKRLGLKVFDVEDSEGSTEANKTEKQKALEETLKVDKSKLDTKKEGEYPVTVTAKDSDGNVGSATFIVTVVKNAVPEITGKEDVRIPVNGKFDISLLELKAYDVEDGDLTKKLVIEGDDKVDTKKAGKYTITTKVADRQGNETKKDFVVKVVSDNRPVIDGKNLELFVGDKFDISMLKITAKDEEDGDLTKEVKWAGKVNTGKVGVYKIVAAVIDSDDNIGVKEFTVKVSEKKPTTTGTKPTTTVTNNNPNTGDTSSMIDLGVGLMALGGLLVVRKR